MKTWNRASAAAAVCALAGLSALCLNCGASSTDASFSGASDGTPEPPHAGGDTTGPSSGDDGGGSNLPPETKNEGAYQSPVATGHVVWIANPESGRVAYIDASSLDVKTVEAGNGPTYLAAIPDPNDDVAIVLNVLSHDATLLRDHAGALSTATFPVTPLANAWAICASGPASGRWALAWTDATSVSNPDPTQGFQDVSVIDLTGARPTTIVAVGYRPVKLAFSADGTRAFAVTQDGVSVIDLAGGSQPTVTQNFALSTDPTEDPGTRDVSITPDGSFALVRRDGQPTLSVVALKDGTLTTVTLPGNATDLTLSPKGDVALAVLRDSATVAILPIPGIATDPTTFATTVLTNEIIGRAIVTKDGKRALLFTTAAAVDRMSVLDLGTLTYSVVRLRSPVLAVFPSDDAQYAVVLHQLDPTVVSQDKGAFSLVPITGNLPAKIVGLPAPPTAVAIAPTSDRAIISMRDDASATYGVYLGKMPTLEVVPYTLASPPIAVGMAAAASRGYVAQDHPEGRITFLDLVGGQARTITGFELGARVVDGSNP